MLLHVNPKSGLPLYRQIETQVKHAVAAGALRPDDAMPSVRSLAAGLRISPNTVARAYQNLERDGVIRAVPGGRTYVADHAPGLLKSEKLRRLRPLVQQLVVEATQLRLVSQDILKIVHDELEKLEERP